MKNIEKRDIQWLLGRMGVIMYIDSSSLTPVESFFRDRVTGIADSLDGKITEESKNEWRDFAECILQLQRDGSGKGSKSPVMEKSVTGACFLGSALNLPGANY